MDAPFLSLSKEQKIDFFVKCQELLIAHHPSSPFLLRKRDLELKLPYVKDFFDKYKGFYCADGNICVLYNHVVILDPSEPALSLRDNMWKPPHPDFNAMSIDFVVFRELRDCVKFCRDKYQARIRHVMFVKNNQPKIYDTEKFVSRLFNLPV